MGLGISHQVPNAKAHPVPIERKRKTRPCPHRLFRGGRVLGDGLRALRHGVLGQLTGQDETDTVAGDVSGTRDQKIGGMGTHEVWISREEMVDFLL